MLLQAPSTLCTINTWDAVHLHVHKCLLTNCIYHLQLGLTSTQRKFAFSADPSQETVLHTNALHTNASTDSVQCTHKLHCK